MFSTNTPVRISEPGPVYVCKHVRDKYDPVVEKMDLLNANPNYAVVRSPEGREVTVSTRDIALLQPVQEKQMSLGVFRKAIKFYFPRKKERIAVRMIFLERMIWIINLICKHH